MHGTHYMQKENQNQFLPALVDSLSKSIRHKPCHASTNSSKPSLQGNASIVARICQKTFQLAPEQQGANTKQLRDISHFRPRCEAAPLHATSDKSSPKLGNVECVASLSMLAFALLARKLEAKSRCCTSACSTKRSTRRPT